MFVWKNTHPFTNEEINTCRAFRASRALRQGLSLGGKPFDPENARKANLILPDKRLKGQRSSAGESASSSSSRAHRSSKTSNKSIGPKIRDGSDWLFLDNYIATWTRVARGDLSKLPVCKPIAAARTFVLRLHDLYDGISWVLTNPYGGLNARPANDPSELTHRQAPHFAVRQGIYTYQMSHILGELVDPSSKFTDLKILVGEIPKDARPCDFEEIEVILNEDVDYGRDPHGDLQHPPDDEVRIRRLQAELNTWLSMHIEWVIEFFESGMGYTGSSGSIARRAGKAWLQCEYGWQWLVWTEYGLDFLESAEGVDWLSDERAARFLGSAYARHWAQLGKAPTEKGGPDKVRRRAWYYTGAGYRWYSHNCPNDIPPKSTLREPEWKSQPREAQPTRYPFHTNFGYNPRLERISDVFINIPEMLCFVRYRSGYDLKIKERT
ncbi:hypothetical protein GGS24DRAFT_516238 [Hypoxylon argillaceum]|nr:hypothetical protein GGS24DRAFT_516238 [Hypoxylon argillaceum]